MITKKRKCSICSTTLGLEVPMEFNGDLCESCNDQLSNLSPPSRTIIRHLIRRIVRLEKACHKALSRMPEQGGVN